jgi:hypothetical protein
VSSRTVTRDLRGNGAAAGHDTAPAGRARAARAGVVALRTLGLGTPAQALGNPDYHAYSVRDEARRTAREAEQERARREQEAEHRRLQAAKWVCPTCRRYVYPEPGLTPGGECRPCRNCANTPKPPRNSPTSRPLAAASSADAAAPDRLRL